MRLTDVSHHLEAVETRCSLVGIASLYHPTITTSYRVHPCMHRLGYNPDGWIERGRMPCAAFLLVGSGNGNLRYTPLARERLTKAKPPLSSGRTDSNVFQRTFFDTSATVAMIIPSVTNSRRSGATIHQPMYLEQTMSISPKRGYE